MIRFGKFLQVCCSISEIPEVEIPKCRLKEIVVGRQVNNAIWKKVEHQK